MDAPDDKDSVLARYMEGPALLERALEGLGEADLDTAPATGGWTIRQIVHHVVDGDDIWKTCIKMALGNEQGEFSLPWYWALTQDEWAEHWAYARRPIEESLALLKATRNHVVQLLEHIPGAWERSAEFRKHDGQVEPVPVGAAIQINADHVEHHVKRIQEIRGELAGARG
jgi:hypothetical protein